MPNYVEPFAGSLAVLLKRPHPPGIETVNDKDCMVANFWRALQSDPDGLARFADWPVNEADLHARHLWLCGQEEFRERMKTDPDYYDVKIAGWWVWGLCCWIGGEWCVQRPNGNPSRRLPHLYRGMGVHRRRPHLSDAGMGVHRKRPNLGWGKGVHRQSLNGSGERSQALLEYFAALASRLRNVRVCCGEWDRVLGNTPTVKLGTTGVFLDPPYSRKAGRDTTIYAEENLDVAHAVREWAIANGDNPLLRIALCGYEGEHQMPESWECVAWKAHGGYANQGNN